MLLRLLLRLVLLTVLSIGCITLYHALSCRSMQLEVEPAVVLSGTEPETERLARLSQALQIQNSQTEPGGRRAIWEWMQANYPELHGNDARISWRAVGGDARLYRWLGKDERLAPVVLVFPLGVQEPPLEEVPRWTYNPYLGKMQEGCIWGVGTRSGKAAAIAFTEAAAAFARSEQPHRTLYWAFLQHSEDDSLSAAQRIAYALKNNGIKPQCVLAYGGMVADTLLLETPRSVALIGIAEKRPLRLRLMAEGNNPEKRISEVLENWRTNPLPADRRGPVQQAFWEYWAPENAFARRWLFANRGGWGLAFWTNKIADGDLLCNDLLNNSLEVEQLFTNAQGQTVAELRWLVQPDIPQEQALQRLQNQCPPDVRMEPVAPLPPPYPVAPTSGYGFNLLQATHRQLFPERLVIPCAQLYPTEARHFQMLQAPIYYTAPLRFNVEQYANDSPIDERLPLGEYAEWVAFYKRLLRNI